MRQYIVDAFTDKTFSGNQASRRGGYLQCERRKDGRMSLRGEAVLVAISELAVSL